MTPVDTNISPYLQQPLRTIEEVLQQRASRQRELAAGTSRQAAVLNLVTDAPPAASPNGDATPGRVDQSV